MKPRSSPAGRAYPAISADRQSGLGALDLSQGDRPILRSWLGIKSKLSSLVKAAGPNRLPWLGLLWISLIPNTRISTAEAGTYLGIDKNLKDADTTPQYPADQTLPPAEVRSFEVKLSARSQSGQIYLFEDPTDAKPDVGNLLLLTQEGHKLMAFRVIRTRAESKMFYAKPVRRYDKTVGLEPGTTYAANEVVLEGPNPRALLAEAGPPMGPAGDNVDDGTSDRVNRQVIAQAFPLATPGATSPALPSRAIANAPDSGTSSDGKDALDIDTGASSTSSPTSSSPPTAPMLEVQSFDPELDAAASPSDSSDATDSENATDELLAPKRDLAAAKSPTNMKRLDDEDSDDAPIIGATADEVTALDPNNHWLSGGGFLLRNTTGLFSGGGMRYGLTFSHMPFLSSASVQDSLALEAGFYFYKTQASATATLSVLPFSGVLRYNVYFSGSASVFAYAGFLANKVIGSTSATDQQIIAHSGFLPAGGLGLIFHIGPNWDVRVDAGYDSIGGSLMLRF